MDTVIDKQAELPGSIITVLESIEHPKVAISLKPVI